MRLIDADALERVFESGTDPCDPYADMIFVRAENIEKMPTIEAVPVLHGRQDKDNTDEHPFCSNCGNEPLEGGARMEGDSE